MADPIGSFSGLASGIQWRDMVDQIMAIESARQLDPLTRESSASQRRIDAWNGYSTVLAKLNAAAGALRDGTPFGNARVTVGNSPTTSRTLLTAAAGTGAAIGSYRVEVKSLAKAERLGGVTAADPNAALGVSGTLRVNGRTVSVVATDSLYAVRDKLNAANTGTQASRVAASVLTSQGRSQLVLTSDVTGAAGIDLDEVRPSAPGAGETTLLAALGLEADAAPTSLRVGADGATRSARMSSATETILASLGVITSPPPARLVVNGREIVIDPATDSLSSIIARVNAESAGAASLETTTEGGATWHRLKIAGTVTAGDADSALLMRAMGLTVASHAGSTTQAVRTGNALVRAADGTTADASTRLDALRLTSGAGAIDTSSTFTVAGTTGDGKPVPAFTIAVSDGMTLDDLATQVESGFALQGRAVAASVEGGKLVVRDTVAGSSQLAVSIAATVTGGTLDLGATSTDPGRVRQLVAGSDAEVVVDGATIRRPTNVIADAIGGTSLTLQQAEVGTEIVVDVVRDDDRAVQAVQDYARAYNDVVSFVEKNTAAGGALAFNGAMRSSLATIRATLLTPVAGLPAGARYERGATIGVALNKSGQLEVDATALRGALTSDLPAVRSFFGTNGASSDAQLQYVGSTSATQAARYTVDVTRAAAAPAIVGTGPFTFAGAAGDAMTVTDGASGRSVTIALRAGDGAASVAEQLQTHFQSSKLSLAATVEGGKLRLASTEYGSAASFTVSYASTAGTDVAGQVGIPAGQVKNGVDAQATVTRGAASVVVTGAGRLLTGPSGSIADGLSLRYAGTSPMAAPATLDFTLGLGGALARAGEVVTRTGSGLVASNTTTLQTAIDRLGARADDVQARLDRRREAMVRQFTVMEAALSRIQSQGNWLTSQVKALQGSND
ncbi:MAG TPA: flagellar filament capping protein FliD [Gemmatimonadaceae bacterium]|nr:flagellar filament capping protein FliD [Gemmatimonadaceae bacterium]